MIQPPPLPPEIPSPTQGLPSGSKHFSHEAAQASLMSPLIAIGVSIVVNVGIGGEASPIVRIIAGSISILLIVLGFVFGIVALFTNRNGRSTGIRKRALAGVCINGILIALMFLSIPAWKMARERAKETRQQQGAQKSPSQP